MRSRPEPLRYSPVATPLGRGFVAWNGRGVIRLDVGVAEPRFTALVRDRFGAPPRRAPLPAALRRRVRRALLGETRRAPVDLSRLQPFQRKVLERTMRIPRGEIRSYGDIAREIGRPRAMRAVGTALARNPVPLLVPCHRVVRGDGSLGSYGLGGGRAKRALLEREGALPRQRGG